MLVLVRALLAALLVVAALAPSAQASGGAYGARSTAARLDSPAHLTSDGEGLPVPAHELRSAEVVGFYYFRLRYLDPEQGRFVNRDPLGIWGDASNLGNGYAFAGNDPVNRVDPWGLEGATSDAQLGRDLDLGGDALLSADLGRRTDVEGDRVERARHVLDLERAEIEAASPDLLDWILFPFLELVSIPLDALYHPAFSNYAEELDDAYPGGALQDRVDLLLEREAARLEVLRADEGEAAYVAEIARRREFAQTAVHQRYLDYAFDLVGGKIDRETLSLLNPYGGEVGPDDALYVPWWSPFAIPWMSGSWLSWVPIPLPGAGAHGVYHDANGWLTSAFGVGRGYGVLNQRVIFAGQVGGFARELVSYPIKILVGGITFTLNAITPCDDPPAPTPKPPGRKLRRVN